MTVSMNLNGSSRDLGCHARPSNRVHRPLHRKHNSDDVFSLSITVTLISHILSCPKLYVCRASSIWVYYNSYPERTPTMATPRRRSSRLKSPAVLFIFLTLLNKVACTRLTRLRHNRRAKLHQWASCPRLRSARKLLSVIPQHVRIQLLAPLLRRHLRPHRR